MHTNTSFATSGSTVFRKWLPFLILSVLTPVLCWLFIGRFGVFGSKIDWLSQHSVIPDYFRQQFYETGHFFPEFAPALGGGQNIYHFAYYGLFSPLILPSYLLPFVKMSTYIMAVSILGLTASVLLFYYWLGTHEISNTLRFTVTLVFLLAGPMICQSCRQIMFVNYMPFLILGLTGVDSFLKNQRTRLLTVSIFLMILTSFYFSICGMLVLFLYGITRFQKSPATLVSRFIPFMIPFFHAVSASAFLLIPTAFALASRSNTGSLSIPWTKLFTPDFSIRHFRYTGYGVGLSSVAFIVLFLGIFLKKSKEKLLSLLCLVILTTPIFSCILNGGLYIRDKAFIPFIPLLCYLIAVFFRDIELPLRPAVFLSPLLLYLFLCGIHMNQSSGNTASADFCKNIWDSSWKREIQAVLEQENGLFRTEQAGSYEEKKANMNRVWTPRQWTTSLYSSTYNQDYQTFLKDTFQTELPYNNAISHASSENPLFQKFMGVKHRISKAANGKFSQETLDFAAPVIYATNALISRSEYEALSFPCNQTALMNCAVTEAPAKTSAFQTKAENTKILQKIMDSAAPVEISFSRECTAQKEGTSYHIESTVASKGSLKLHTAPYKKKQLYFLQFDIENQTPNQSIIIEVNKIRNKLSAANHIYHNDNTTFTFVTELNAGQTTLPLFLGKGNYTLSNIKSYIGNISLLTDTSLYQAEFQPDWKLTHGNRICGLICIPDDGYAVTSIPFDKGFHIRLDGHFVSPEKVNTAFLGFPVKHGTHRLEITFHAPGALLGKLISLLTLLLTPLFNMQSAKYASGWKPSLIPASGVIIHLFHFFQRNL